MGNWCDYFFNVGEWGCLIGCRCYLYLRFDYYQFVCDEWYVCGKMVD